MKKYKYIKPLGDTTCAICGNIFYNNTRHEKKYCSESCKMWKQRKISYSYYKNKELDKQKKIKKVCVMCNKEFYTNRIKQKFCSFDCSRKYWIDKCSNAEYSLSNNLYLKTRFEIFKRDNFTCQYCGRNVKEDKIKLNLDHIIPRNKGGKDEVNNYITSCFECNEGKKDILLEVRMLNKENKHEEED